MLNLLIVTGALTFSVVAENQILFYLGYFMYLYLDGVVYVEGEEGSGAWCSIWLVA